MTDESELDRMRTSCLEDELVRVKLLDDHFNGPSGKRLRQPFGQREDSPKTPKLENNTISISPKNWESETREHSVLPYRGSLE